MRSRKGQNTYIILLTFAFITALIVGYFIFSSVNTTGFVHPDIGEKQEAIINAHATAKSIEATMHYAAIQSTQNIVHTALRAQTPPTDLPGLMQQEFSGLMQQHPLRVDAAYTVRQGVAPNEYYFDGLLKIPIEESFASLKSQNTILDNSGIFAVYPVKGETPTPENERVITSLFGYRNVAGGSANHPGIDLRAEVGQEVLALANGHVYSRSANSVYILLANGWECAYFHVRPVPGIPTSVEDARFAPAGETIGTVQNIPNHHVHLECWNNNIVTPESAPSIFGIEHVGTTQETKDTTAYAAISQLRDVASLDVYCLFPPSIRDTIQIKEDASIEGQLFVRAGGTKEQKLVETCNAYTGSSILTAPVAREPVTVDASADVTLTKQRLEAPYTGPYGQYSSLTFMIEEVATEHGVDPLLAIAMVSAESVGKPNADSPTGVCGLFQVTQDTASGYLHEKEHKGKTVTLPKREVRFTREHCDAYLQTQAGVQHIKSLLGQFKSHTINNREVPLTNQVAYMAAAYNGGTGIVHTAIKRTNLQDPNYEHAMRTVSAETLLTNGYSQWSLVDRQSKIQEIVNHGRKVAAYYAELGGSVPLLTASSSRFGIYTYPAFVSHIVDTSIITSYTQARASLATCTQVDGSCAAQLGVQSFLAQAENLRRCTPPAEQYQRIIHSCRSDYNEGTCACRIPTQQLPTVLDDDVQPINTMQFKQHSIDVLQGEQTTTTGVDWMGAFGDPQLAANFFVQTMASEELTIDFTTQQVSIENGAWLPWNRVATEAGVDEGAFYLKASARDDEAVQFTLLETGGSNVCKATTPEQYCFEYDGESYTFWIDHPVDIEQVEVENSAPEVPA